MKTLDARWLKWTAAAVALTFAAGCGDDDTGGDDTVGDTALFDTGGGFPDGTNPTDTTPSDTTAATDSTAATDTSPPDLIPDTTAPEIVSSSPANGAGNVALPLVVTVTFDEALYAPTVSAGSVKLLGPDLAEIAANIALSADGKTVTITPQSAATIKYASPYTVRLLANIVSDLAGNRWSQNQEIAFTTANWPDQDDFRSVAERYAPVIHSVVDDSPTPQTQIPTKLDSDSDWNLSDNVTWLKQEATSIIPAVYYNVAETRTHYFVHYMLYFPWMNQSDSLQYGNGTSGYMVTVEKARASNGNTETPIAVHTYYALGNGDDINQAFVTTESGIVATSPSGWCAHEEIDQATLFPEGRFEAYVTTRANNACLWVVDDSSIGTGCPMGADVRARNQLIFEFGGGAPTPVTKVGNAWPRNMTQAARDSYDYVLIPMLSTVWPRRYQTGATGLFQVSTPVAYAADANRPGGGTALPTRFLDPIGLTSIAFGRPAWGWGYSLTSGSCDTGKAGSMTRGQMALDPAWYVWERHTKASSPDVGLQAYDTGDGTGFSVDYCFNALVNVDQRGVDPACQ